MRTIQFDAAYANDQWMSPAYIQVSDNGTIQSVSESCCDKIDQRIHGVALPSFKNAHSHCFQYAMAGLSEYQAKDGAQDNFWSWRNAMYELAEKITPEDLHEIAMALYHDLLSNGYTSVVEFHYLQNDTDGSPYSDRMTLYHPLIAAAENVGIKLTIAPVYYNTGNFNQSASTQQKRFIFRDVENYIELLELLQKMSGPYGIAYGVHSLRASRIEDLKEIIANKPSHSPFHIHISEQVKEVSDCQFAHGLRPVDLLFESVDVDSTFNLVHATHLTEGELQKIISSQANVVLCPATEGNLGDGIFPLREFHKNGNWSIGSDSHICRNPIEELRWLDYGQRLIDRIRNPLCSKAGQHSGDELLKKAWGGEAAYSLGESASLQPGAPLDATVYSSENSFFYDQTPQSRLDALVFSGHTHPIYGVFSQGVWREVDALKQNRLKAHSNLKQLISRFFH